jgi:hypothetical protein
MNPQKCNQLSGVTDLLVKAPARDRDQDPCNRPDDERGETVFRRQKPHSQRKCSETDAAQSGAGGVERRRIGSPTLTSDTALLFALTFVLFDQSCARTKDGREGEKKSAHLWPV